MSEPQPPNAQSKPDEIPLSDIDALLEQEDPEFAKSLEELGAVESNTDVIIDATAIDESLVDEDKFTEGKPQSTLTALKLRAKLGIKTFRAKLKARLFQTVKDFWVFLKVSPKRFLFFSVGALQTGFKTSMVPVKAFQVASKPQRLAVLLVLALGAGSAWVLIHNFKGIWLPQINEPLLQSFEPWADHVEKYNPKEEGESFYSAFPQERHEFLFPKMKVNLRRTAENPNPMGAFEVIVLLDSKDTAIEVSDREVEFSDMLQRVFEEETFNDLESELGKSRLKSRLKRELNQKLTQGWAKDISFKTFILKP